MLKKSAQSEEACGSVDQALIGLFRREAAKFQRKRMRTREEAAEYMGCSPSTIDNLVKEGKLHPSYYTRRPMFDVLELDRLIEETRGQVG
jgi:helix-turn-helix protein